MKRHSDACERNKDPILDVLTDYLDDGDRVLEVGSGTGQHAVYFADQLPVVWQPADRPDHTDSVRARWRDADLEGLREPVELDIFDDTWEVGAFDALVAINVLQIAPEEAIGPLFDHADEVLEDEAAVYIYGPFKYRDRELEPSNRRFDRSLRARDPEKGLRYAGDVVEAAEERGFEFVEDRPMPANNRSLVWRR